MGAHSLLIDDVDRRGFGGFMPLLLESSEGSGEAPWLPPLPPPEGCC